MQGQPQLSLLSARIAARLILVEAFICLLLARLALGLFSFQRLTWYFNLKARQPELSGEQRIQECRAVRNALFRVYSCYLPWATCFHWAIAAQTMLRWRGVSSTLYYGAATLSDRGLAAHTWLMAGDEGVTGIQVAQQDGYKILARYPEE